MYNPVSIIYHNKKSNKMKKQIVTALLVIMVGLTSFRQITLTQKTNQLPVTEAAPIQKADLSIPAISLLSAKKTDDKLIVIRVSITIKNSGEVQAPITQLSGFFKIGGNKWKAIDDKTTTVGVVSPRDLRTNEYTFKIKAGLIGTKNFTFRVKVDGGNSVNESDELNNYSTGILIGL
jgi:hypothetical protein